MRAAVLGFNLAKAAPLRLALSALVVAGSVTVFAFTSTLSELATSSLDEAVVQEFGDRGVYRVDFVAHDEWSDRDVFAIASALSSFPFYYGVEVNQWFPPLSVGCRKSVREERPVVLRWSADGRPLGLPYPTDHDDAGDCMDGLALPELEFQESIGSDSAKWSDAVLVDNRFSETVAAATLGLVSYSLVVTTGNEEDVTAVLDQLIAEYREMWSPLSIRSNDYGAVVGRLDLDGRSIVVAARGSAAVFDVLAMAIVGLGGIALMSNQLMAVRSRRRMFGLALALGARRRSIAMLVTAEVAFGVALGGAASGLCLFIAAPALESFAETTFSRSIEMGQVGDVLVVIAGSAIILCIAVVAPIWRAIRTDALDVLERHVG